MLLPIFYSRKGRTSVRQSDIHGYRQLFTKVLAAPVFTHTQRFLMKRTGPMPVIYSMQLIVAIKSLGNQCIYLMVQCEGFRGCI